MSEISDRYRRLSAEFTRRVESVPPGRWDDQSPCPDWTARQVLGHVVDTQRTVAGYVGSEITAGRSVADDPAGSWAAARDGLQSLLDDPDTAQREFDGMGGRTSLENTVDLFLCFDLVVHGWDIARATGGDERMDASEVERIRRQAEGFGDTLRTPGGFAPALDPPDGATAQDRLLAFLGRRP